MNVSPRELITVCRQIGGMMEADVDILRITRVLRSQTDNERLQELYDDIDHELTMGRGLADAMSRAPDVFSPFAVSLIRQGEERNNLGAAFLRVADFLQKEIETPAAPERSVLPPSNTDHSSPATGANGVVPNIGQASGLSIEILWRRLFSLLATLVGLWAGVTTLVALGWLQARWQTPLALFLCAGVLAWWARPTETRTSRAAEDERLNLALESTFDGVPASSPGQTKPSANAMNPASTAERPEWTFFPTSETENDDYSGEDPIPLEQWKQRTNRRVEGEEEAFD
jgi:hypothetical protein